MRYYMFGMDADTPEECAREMRLRGISTVVGPPNVRAAEACRKEGLCVYACFGAYGMRSGDPDAWLSEDAFGNRRRWFGSGCPREDALFERNLTDGIQKAKATGASGILADGLRFASPAPGSELFLSCFCPRCREKGEKLGFDMDAMRSDVQAFAKTPGRMPPEKWLAYREACVAEGFSAFRKRVEGEGLESGSFVFADSLSALVGQTARAAQGLSILAPMLYRRYRKRPGIACLNDEYAALYALYESRGDADPALEIERFTGVAPPSGGTEAILERGFEPSAIAWKTARARSKFSGRLAPILQLDDERLRESIRAAVESGADSVGFFAYEKESFANMPELH